MPKSRWSAFVSLLLVFLSGALVSAVGYRLYEANRAVAVGPPSRPKPDEVIRQRLKEMRERVKADDQQLEQIKQVYAETGQEFDRMRQKMSAEGRAIDDRQVAKIKSILRPDQIPVYDTIRAEHEAERKRRQQQNKNDHK